MLSLWSAACHAFLTRCPPPEGEYCGWELWYFVRGIKKCHASTCFDAGRQKMCILRELLLRWRKCQGQTLFAAEVALQELLTSTCKRCIFLPAHNSRSMLREEDFVDINSEAWAEGLGGKGLASITYRPLPCASQRTWECRVWT